MGNFFEFVTADRRLTILKTLQEDPGYSQNIYVLQTCLAALGHETSLDLLKTDLAWLKEQGLVRLDLVAGVMVAKLTTRGDDVASGRTVVPGVKRPSPEL